MKKISSLIAILLLCTVSLFAQAPEKFTYQAVVRNASNSLVANAQVGVRVNILQGSATGDAVYSESHVTNTNANGLITVNIGGGSLLHGSFTGIDWPDGPYFLKTDIDPNGGNDYTITSVQQLLSVPYALYAKEAANSFSGDYNDLTNTPQIPTVPTDVSAFNNDAGYITGYTETDPQFNAWDKNYNDLTNKPTIPTVPTNVSAFNNDAGYITNSDIPVIPTVPTNVSAFTNDAGYISGYTETDPQFNAWDKDYNDLINKPTIPTVPTNVSAFNNDAGYITSAAIPTIPTIPTNVSAFTNDAGYLTSYTETDPLFTAWDKSYNDLTNKPTIPTVPTNVSAFTNDAGYITSYTEIDPLFTAWDKNYNDLTNKPDIPTVPTNLSAFNNDAGYITGYTETDPLFTAWDKNYNDLTNKPTIPTVPTNVSAFTNDAGYLTAAEVQQAAGVPTVVSAFQNDAGYITAAQVPAQVNADWNATTGAAQILNKPTLFSGNYNDLTNLPQIPQIPADISAFNNDAGYITGYTETDPQFNAWDKNYNDLTNKPAIPTVPTDVSAFNNDAGYITAQDIPTIPTIPTNVSAFTNDAGYLTSYIEQQVLSISNDTIFLTGGSFVKLPEGFSGSWNDLTDKPENISVPDSVSAFVNDAGYITMDAVPTIPANVSVFENDAHYITDVQLQQIMSTIATMQNTIDSMGLVMEALYNQINQPDSIPAGIDTGLHVTFTIPLGSCDSLTVHDAKFATSDQSSINDIDHHSSTAVPITTIGIEGYWVIYASNCDFLNSTTFIDVNKNVTITDLKIWGLNGWYGYNGSSGFITPTSGTHFEYAQRDTSELVVTGQCFLAIKFEVNE